MDTKNCPHNVTFQFDKHGMKYCYDCHQFIHPNTPLQVQMAAKGTIAGMFGVNSEYRDGLD